MVHDIDKIKAKVKKIDNINANVSNTIQRVTYETEEITVTPKTEEQVIKPTKGKFINKVTANPVTAAIDSDIVSENIREGINILGVKGNYIGLDTSDATATANDIISPRTAYISGEKVTGTIQVEYYTGEYNVLGSILTNIAFTNPTFDLVNKCVVDWVYDQSLITIYKYNTSYIITDTKTITFDEIGLSDQVLNSVSVAYNNAGNNTRIYINAGRKYESKSMILAYVDIDESLEVIDYKTYTLSTNSGAISAGRISAIPHKYNKFIIQYHYSNTASTATSFSVVKEFEIVSGEFQELNSIENGYLTGSGVFRDYTGTLIFRNIFDIKYSNDGNYAILYSHYQLAAGEIRITRIIDVANGLTVLNDWGEEKHCYFLGDKVVVDTSIYLLPNLTTKIGTGTALKNSTSRTLGDYVAYWVDSSNIQIIDFDESTSKTKTIKALSATTTGVSPYTCDSYGAVYLQTSGVYVLENSITEIPSKINVKGNILHSTIDTTAGADDILSPKTAYVNGSKVTGTIKNNGSLNYTPSTSSQTIPTGYTSGGTIAAVDSSIDSNIAEGNIKAGVSILGVTGTYEGTGGSGEAVKGVFEGEEAELTNSIEGAVIEEFAVKGKTTQDGTPTPDTPVEIQNITGNIVVKVTNGTNEQTVTFRLGSQKLMKGGYLADDGIHAFRVQQVLTGNESISYVSAYKYFAIPLAHTSIQWWQDVICNYFPYIGEVGTGVGFSNSNNTANAWLFDYDGYFGQNANTFKTFLANKYAAGDPVIIEYKLATEMITPYTQEQQEDWNNLKQLTTYAGTTIISTENKMKIGGKSTQDGTPTPDNPIDIQNMTGDVNINITGGIRTQTITFPLGEHILRKGDYLADDGIHINMGQVIFDGTNYSFTMSSRSTGEKGFWIDNSNLPNCLYEVHDKKCNYFEYQRIKWDEASIPSLAENTLTSATKMILFNVSADFASSVDEWNAKLASWDAAGKPLTVEYQLATPEVIAYTEEQQTAWDNLKKLVTYGGVADIEIVSATKPVLSGEYYMKAPELPIVLTNVNGTLQINLKGKNLFNANGGYDYETGTAKVTHTIVEANKIIVVNTTNAWNRLGCNISGLKPNTEYTVSSDVTNTGGLNCGFYGANNDNMFIETLTNFKGNLTVLTDSNGNLHFEFYTNFSSNITDGTVIYDNIQLEEGTEATEYEPYRKITLVDDQTATITMATDNKTIISLI